MRCDRTAPKIELSMFAVSCDTRSANRRTVMSASIEPSCQVRSGTLSRLRAERFRALLLVVMAEQAAEFERHARRAGHADGQSARTHDRPRSRDRSASHVQRAGGARADRGCPRTHRRRQLRDLPVVRPVSRARAPRGDSTHRDDASALRRPQGMATRACLGSPGV